MPDLIGHLLGWLGTLGTFSAYLLLMRGRLAPEALRYSTLNAVGGVLAAGGAFAYGAWPAVGSNILWAGIGIHGIVLALRRMHQQRRFSSAVTVENAEWEPIVWHPGLTHASSISLPWLDQQQSQPTLAHDVMTAA